ncbi:MAG: Flp family type IVb pilin [Robiginitomaculum sp.]|nr:Flp family type IVb pilin [Robiginitomaculum sp.]
MYSRLQTMFSRLARDESGATAIEYGMLVAILAVGLIVGITGIAVIVTDMWDGVGSSVNAT